MILALLCWSFENGHFSRKWLIATISILRRLREDWSKYEALISSYENSYSCTYSDFPYTDPLPSNLVQRGLIPENHSVKLFLQPEIWASNYGPILPETMQKRDRGYQLFPAEMAIFKSWKHTRTRLVAWSRPGQLFRATLCAALIPCSLFVTRLWAEWDIKRDRLDFFTFFVYYTHTKFTSQKR